MVALIAGAADLFSSKEYLSSTSWWAQNYGDLLLHQAASMSLDRTIAEIGVDVFNEALEKFRSMMKTAAETCQPVFPCSSDGTDQSIEAEDDCYFEDIGCGYPCLDTLETVESS